MTSGHPVVWLWLVGLTVLIASSSHDPLPILALGASLTACGLLARTARGASFVASLATALAASALWFLWMVLAPGASVEFWLAGSASAVTVCVVFGVAGQLVSTRGWLSLAALTGPFAPALGWLCGMGEACAEVAERHRLNHRSNPRLRTWFTALAALPQGVPGVSVRNLTQLPRGHFLQGIAAALLTACWAAYDSLGAVAFVAAATLLPVSVAFSHAPEGVTVHG